MLFIGVVLEICRRGGRVCFDDNQHPQFLAPLGPHVETYGVCVFESE